MKAHAHHSTNKTVRFDFFRLWVSALLYICWGLSQAEHPSHGKPTSCFYSECRVVLIAPLAFLLTTRSLSAVLCVFPGSAQVIESMKYFLDSMPRIMKPDFVASSQDILHIRIRSSGEICGYRLVCRFWHKNGGPDVPRLTRVKHLCRAKPFHVVLTPAKR